MVESELKSSNTQTSEVAVWTGWVVLCARCIPEHIILSIAQTNENLGQTTKLDLQYDKIVKAIRNVLWIRDKDRQAIHSFPIYRAIRNGGNGES